MTKQLLSAIAILTFACGGNVETEVEPVDLGSSEQALSIQSNYGTAWNRGWRAERCDYNRAGNCLIPYYPVAFNIQLPRATGGVQDLVRDPGHINALFGSTNIVRSLPEDGGLVTNVRVSTGHHFGGNPRVSVLSLDNVARVACTSSSFYETGTTADVHVCFRYEVRLDHDLVREWANHWYNGVEAELAYGNGLGIAYRYALRQLNGIPSPSSGNEYRPDGSRRVGYRLLHKNDVVSIRFPSLSRCDANSVRAHDWFNLDGFRLVSSAECRD